MSLYLMLQTVATVLALFLFLATFVRHNSPKSRYWFLLTLAIFLYSFGYLLELDSSTFEAAYLSQRIQYLGIAYVSLLFYLFIRDYGGRPVTNGWYIAAIAALPSVSVVSVNLYPDVRSFFRELNFRTVPCPHLSIERGVLFDLSIAYTVLFLILSIVEVLLHYPNKTGSDRVKRLVFSLATLVPCIPTILYGVLDDIMPMDFGSVSMVVSAIIFGYYILIRRVQDWLPYAKEMVLDRLNDGFIMLDNDMRYLDANAAAKRYFPPIRGLAEGDPVSELDAFPEELLRLSGGVHDFRVTSEKGSLMLRATAERFTYRGRPVCICIALYDVTELRQLIEEMEVRATRDSLTDILNRGAFFAMASRDFDLHLRVKHPAVLMMMDLDNFKQINDTYGHQAGDMVLKEFAGILNERLRHTDISGRYGGEEFCVFLPATALDSSLPIANDIRHRLENRRFTFRGESFFVTVSIGIAPLDPVAHKTLDDLITDADAELYRAKDGGRNRIVVKEASAGGVPSDQELRAL